MRADTHALVGAYVLDALDERERREFESHLRSCTTCSDEVLGLRETTVRLGRAAALAPPERLKQNVMARLAGTRQLPPEGLRRRETAPRRKPRDGLTRWPFGVALGAAVVAAFLLIAGTLTFQAADRADRAEERARIVAAVLTAPDARTVVDSGGTLVVSRERDLALFTGTLAPAPEGHVYELWLLDRRGRPSPAGLVEHPTTIVTGLRGATGLAVTVEPDGGSDRPTTQPVTSFKVG